MPLLMDSPLWSPELKTRLRHGCSQYLSERLESMPKIIQARRQFYMNACRYFEIVYAHNQTMLIASAYESYDPSILCATLDQNLPQLVDAARMSDDMLQKQIDQIVMEDPSSSLDWIAQDDEEGEETITIPLENVEAAQTAIGEFSQICIQAKMLGLVPQMSDFVYAMASKRFQLPEDSWDQVITEHVLQQQLLWMRLVVLPWYSHCLQEIDVEDGSQVRKANLADWYRFLRDKIVLEHTFYNAFYDSRVERIFDIITEFPSSKPVVEDLKFIADKSSSEKLSPSSIPHLIKDAVLKEFRTRLLRNGTWATDILQQYILCIQCLKVIDPTCSILVPIIDVMRDYWSSKRSDVVPAVVDMIREGEEYGLDDENIYEFGEGEIERQDDNKDERGQLSRLQQMSLDPIAMLISICGATTDFVEKYQEKLGKALMLSNNYETDEEMIKLEMLKRRFPENTMTSCDIMIKDMAESRRLDRQIHEDEQQVQSTFHAMILSRHYWPEEENADDDDYLQDEGGSKQKGSISILEDMDQTLKAYQDKFKHYKANRKLHWTPNQGSVSIELEFRSRTVEMTIDPSSALVISIFQGKDQRYTDEEVAKKTNLDLTKVMESLEYWEKEGILILSSDSKYQLVEE
ncbi:hypothetical protein BDA99DRAFT_119205 [Phascolomyces articulosus]|uniref:Cullin family profile domain-containing protein n=1 Tax=Phascolomyces articulosus TaxID=60185 RepID=A0AAD5KP67_9FUNG|nr:hypothetical protein BDA99DRAFT_119205 [Phascolomyces articulosus]